MKKIILVREIDLREVYEWLHHPEAGGINFFIGNVRNHAHGRAVVRLHFEGYEPMAIRQMEEIAAEAMERWPIKRLLMVHALGDKEIGDPVVVIGTATAHRNDAFEASRYLIDELKNRVPIWKKEYFTDNTVWVNAHP